MKKNQVTVRTKGSLRGILVPGIKAKVSPHLSWRSCSIMIVSLYIASVVMEGELDVVTGNQ